MTHRILFVAVVFSAACAAPEPMEIPVPAPGPIVPAVLPAAMTPMPMPAQAMQDPQSQTDFNQVLHELRQEYSLAEQERHLTAQQHYELAVRHLEAGDFERANDENERALTIDSNHGPAQALRRELAIHMGNSPVTPQDRMVQDLIEQEQTRRQQVLVEIQDKYDAAVRAFNDMRFTDAEENLLVLLEYIRWMPVGPDLESLRRNAVDLLERTRQEARRQALQEEETRARVVAHAVEAREAGQILERRRQMNLLFEEAAERFEEERYADVIRICDRLLEMEPRLESVREMRNAAQRLQWTRERDSNLRTYVEEWKRVFETLDLQSVVQTETIRFPERDIWDMIRARETRRQREVEETVNPQDQAIDNRLASQEFGVIGQYTLRELADYLMTQTGTNVILDPRLESEYGVDPDSETFDITAANLPIRTVLNFYLRTVDPVLTYEVRDGIIWIIAEAELMRRTYLDIYDIKEITYALPDFEGQEIDLLGGAAPPPPPADEGAPPFDITQLQELIEQVIEPDGWQGDYDWSISPEEGQGLLVVKTIPRVHAAIRELLNDLRATTGVLVNVEARFLTVEDRFLQQIGMDFRDLDRVPVAFAGARAPIGLLNPADVNNAFEIPSRFFDPDQAGPLSPTSTGIVGRWGTSIARTLGMRVQHLMMQDQVLSRFLSTVWGAAGGMALQYILVDDLSVSALLRAVEKTGRGHTVNAPRLTLFNTQRGNMLVANQMAYIRDWDVNIAAATIVPQPVIDVATDGISLDVRPIVSEDRRFVTLELRPTVAVLTPPPPNIRGIPTVIGGSDVTAATTGRVVTIEVPELSVQRLRTTVVLPDRGTVIIGGLGMYFDVDAESSVPMWKRFALLNFFGDEKFKGRHRQQLLIIVRAEIIIPSEEERHRFD